MKARVIYVDDESINLELFSLLIGKYFDVVCASSGMEALDLIKKDNSIRMVITDMKMPVMNGLELIYEVKKHDSNLPCVILSGYQQTEKVSQALKGKIILKYLMKPFRKDEMISLIENEIGN